MAQGINSLRVYKAMTAGKPSTMAGTDTIPFEYHNNVIIIKGKVNGQSLDFIVDTGAPSIIWEEAARSLKLEKSPVASTSTDANGKEQKIEFYAADEVQVGNLKLEKMNLASVSTLSEEIKCYASGGILGGNFLRHFNWQIDYDRKCLVASSHLTKLTIPKGAIKVEAEVATLQGRVSIGNVQLLGQRETFILDTGSRGFISLDKGKWNPQKAALALPYTEAYGYSRLSAGGREKTISYVIQTDFVTPMGTLQDAVLEVDTDRSKLGNSFLSQFGVVTIDYTSKSPAVYFPPRAVKSIDNKTWGFTPVYDKTQKGFVIGSIYKNSPVEKAGLQVGDRILAINGQDLRSVEYSDYCGKNYTGEASYTMVGDVVTLTVERNGRQEVRELKKYLMFSK
ncbi:hypothetical protein GCM10023186_36620 [Hymenobacter koreensis]|uniref:PDZ domain-containing protein n=1 Tax=Hymenobacter koreensis TaxID=1084523 RepID=A0ABP8JE58_9BACT